MVVVETRRGIFHLVEVFYARKRDEAEVLRNSLALNQIVYIRQALTRLEVGRAAAWYRPTSTILLDLGRKISDLFAEANATCRNLIRRADRVSARTEIRRNDAVAYADFIRLYNRFVEHSRHSEPLSSARLDGLRPISDVFVAYFEGRPLCGHVLVRDETIGRVGLLLSASTRLEGSDAPAFVGSINRWLHWYEIQLYKSEGMLVYDFGGASADTHRLAGIAHFKQSFGGTQVQEHDYIAARPTARMAISLFYAMRQMRSRETRKSGAGHRHAGWTRISAGGSIPASR